MQQTVREEAAMNSGDIIGGRFEVGEFIRQGGMGAVYRGRWWLDVRATTGIEGNPMAMGNIVAAL